MKWFKSVYKKIFKNAIYKGAEVGRLLWDWVVSPLTADAEIRQDIRRLRARARDLAKNSPTIRHYLTLLTANVLGQNGIKLQAQIRNNNGKLNKKINDKIENAWKDWTNDISVDGRYTLVQLQNLALKTVATDGEVFIRKVFTNENKYGFALQLIDPDLVDSEYNVPGGNGKNEIRLGVEVNNWGRPLAYHVLTRHPNDILAATTETKRVRVPADEVIHLYDPDRINQTRGITWFNSVMIPLRMLDGYQEAELVAARTAAAKMGWLQYKDVSAFEPPDPNNPVRIEASPGTVETLPPGMEFVAWSPDHPANAFPMFIKTILRQIATGLRVSYNALANDLEGVNYSSMRSGLLIEREQWKIIQKWWSDKFLQSVYQSWIQSALLTGTLILDTRDFRKFLAVKWLPRGWDWVDPLKDIQAHILGINNGLESRTQALAERGNDFEEILEQLADEKSLAEDYGLSFANTTQPESKPATKKDFTDTEETPRDCLSPILNSIRGSYEKGK
ncbi:MAG: phage portal protein [Candidatus Jettenia caeni]|nr:MAG: phage portal protein [Candidatus Jettenia caeni]